MMILSKTTYSYWNITRGRSKNWKFLLSNERKDLLKMVGIDIALDELIKLYKKE